mgnify:FL=1
MLEVQQQQIELTTDDIAKWNVLIAIPCYDRQITEPFFMSMIKACMAFKEIGLRFGISTISDSLISRARNQVAAKFMANKDFTHLLFLDVDLAFNHEDIIKMLWHDKDIMTGSYPIKNINWDRVASLAKQGVAPSDLAKKSTRFVVNPALAMGETTVKVDNGAMAIYDAGTGFMLIKRQVLEKMFEAYPELKYNDDTGTLTGDERKNSYALFNSYVDEEKRFLSEDYGFCRYWQKLGGEVWVDPSIELMHLGRFEYTGSMVEWLMEHSAPQGPQ